MRYSVHVGAAFRAEAKASRTGRELRDISYTILIKFFLEPRSAAGVCSNTLCRRAAPGQLVAAS
jgi:hypothetical protein